MSKTIQNRIVNDEELILRLQRGDEWAFQLLVRRFRAKIFSIAYGITLDVGESQDIMQEVFLQVHRHIYDFRGDSALATWLHRITVNQCLNWKRRWARRLRWKHISLDDPLQAKSAELPGDAPSAEEQLLAHQAQAQIKQAMQQLPPKIRTIFVLREIEGLSYEEIAAAAAIKVGTVRSRLFNARQRIKQIIDGQSGKG